MKLFTQKQERLLLNNGRLTLENERFDPQPVIKLFTPWSNATWLLAFLYPNNPNIAFGLCDLGFGFPELGDVDLNEVRSIRGLGGLMIERDRSFFADKSLQGYSDTARECGYIQA
jgi:hypothetical protein